MKKLLGEITLIIVCFIVTFLFPILIHYANKKGEQIEEEIISYD